MRTHRWPRRGGESTAATAVPPAMEEEVVEVEVEVVEVGGEWDYQ